MARNYDDSDGSGDEEVEPVTAVVLGFTDGLIPSKRSSDLVDWRISRIGGHPSFPQLPSTLELSPSSSTCQICSLPMPLITQIYSPLPHSHSERILYTFSCSRRSCRNKRGSVRAWRLTFPFNDDAPPTPASAPPAVVAPQVKKEALALSSGLDLGNLIFFGAVRDDAIVDDNAMMMKSNNNPFAPSSSTSLPVSGSGATHNPFLFVASSSSSQKAKGKEAESSQDASIADGLSNLSLSHTSALTTSPPPPSIPARSHSWPAHLPFYPAQYLATAYEPDAAFSASTPASEARLSTATTTSTAAEVVDEFEATHRAGKGAGGRAKKGAPSSSSSSSKGGLGANDGWGKEAYEVQKIKGVDEVFLRFVERVARGGGKQCVRYSPFLPPLPFSLSPSYRSLFPSSSNDSSAGDTSLGIYAPEKLPRCEKCGRGRMFEYQLMPFLVTLLNRSRSARGPTSDLLQDGSNKVGTVEQDVLSKEKEKGKLEDEDGLDWAIAMVFTCAAECPDSSFTAMSRQVDMGELKSEREVGWSEEYVVVEWET